MMRSAYPVFVALFLLASCGDVDGVVDSSGPIDSGADDSSTPIDSGGGDSSGPIDSGADDSSTPIDSGGGDSSTPIDSGAGDSGDSDSGDIDSGVLDSGGFDSGPPMDAGACVDPPPSDRVAPATCSPCRPTWPDPSGGFSMCMTHSECTAGDNGRCVNSMVGTLCDYDDCFVDTDCPIDEVCSCDGAYFGSGNRCVASNCRAGSDCASGRCSPTYGCLLGGPPSGWYCRTTTDVCTADADCDMGPGIGSGRCAYNFVGGIWDCAYDVCIP